MLSCGVRRCLPDTRDGEKQAGRLPHIDSHRMIYLHELFDRVGSGTMLAGTLVLNLISMIDKGLVTFVLGTIATLLYIANQLITLRKNTRKKKEQDAEGN